MNKDDITVVEGVYVNQVLSQMTEYLFENLA